jgi:hypothetical protein
MSHYRHLQPIRTSTDPKDHAEDRAGLRGNTSGENRIALALETIADDLSAIRAHLDKIEGNTRSI